MKKTSKIKEITRSKKPFDSGQPRKEAFIKIKEKTFFTFAHRENAERVALALAFSGYYVRCSTTSSGYTVYVYITP